MSEQQLAVGMNPAAIRKAVGPLIGWYRANKPAVTRVAITAADMRQLASAVPRTLRNNKITRVDDKFYFDGFELYQKP